MTNLHPSVVIAKNAQIDDGVTIGPNCVIGNGTCIGSGTVFDANVFVGDNVIVVNAEKVQLTGRKADQKQYFRHSGYPGGIKVADFSDMIKNKPERVITLAVKGMLPHNRLGRKIVSHLKVYRGPDHPHDSQQPEVLEI